MGNGVQKASRGVQKNATANLVQASKTCPVISNIAGIGQGIGTGDAMQIAINSGVLATSGSISSTKLASGTSSLGLGRAVAASSLHQSINSRAFSATAPLYPKPDFLLSKENVNFDNMLLKWTDNASHHFNKLIVTDQDHSLNRTELGAIEVVCGNILAEKADAILAMANPELANEEGYTRDVKRAAGAAVQE